MQLTEQEIKALVEKVVADVQKAGASGALTAGASPTSDSHHSIGKTISLGDGVFATVDEAVAAAQVAEAKMAETTLLTRKNMIKLMRETSLMHAEELAKLAVDETGLGRVEDKVGKNVLAAEKTPGVEDLVSTTYTGDDGLTLVEAAPIGIIGSITPVTNPGATIINNSISMVAAGNVVVYNPHPSAKVVSLYAMQLLNKAIVAAGGPANVLTAVAEPSLETSNQVMTHPSIRALVVTGGGAVVKAAMGVGKKVIAAGPGNPPCVVDETADIAKAGKDIVFGASFDNNVLCTAEKEIFVVDKVANGLKAAMAKNNAMELKGFQLEKVLKVVLTEKNGRFYPNREFIGKDASII
ncbi:MAG: aldehyde dehydrogenase [Bacillus sp. (in: Bacteria)]|nr:aldehyde dehydrogenase [Bacillus sp. (in: firmicutes)]